MNTLTLNETNHFCHRDYQLLKEYSSNSYFGLFPYTLFGGCIIPIVTNWKDILQSCHFCILHVLSEFL